MSRISWDAPGTRSYETGIDRGVLYLTGQTPVAWNGLVSVNETPAGGTITPYYLDGQKYVNVPGDEEFAATLAAFTYPDEFSVCDGTVEVNPGLFIKHQPRQPFSFSYRTLIGNDAAGNALGDKLHLIYNAWAEPTQVNNQTVSDTPSLTSFSWNIVTLAPSVTGFQDSAHVVIDSSNMDPDVLSNLEDILYGTDTTDGRLPGFDELVDITGYYSNLVSVIDNFNDNSINHSIWTISFGSGAIAETNSKLNLTATTGFCRIFSTPNFDLSTGIVAARLYNNQDTGIDANTQLWFGVQDTAGNAVRVNSLPGVDQWSWHADAAATISNPVGPFVGLGGSWEDGDFLGIGNYDVSGNVYLYKSKHGGTWTQIGSVTVGGTFGHATVGIIFGCGIINSGTSTYVASLDDASIFKTS